MGDKNKITHEFSDGTLEKIMRDIDTGKISKSGNWFMSHPAYYGTSIQQKVPTANKCLGCIYYRKSQLGSIKKCRFPWDNPKTYDKANQEFLPCKGVRKDEKD